MSDAVQFIRSGNGLRLSYATLSYAQFEECGPAACANSSVARQGSFVKRRSLNIGDALRRKATLNQCRRGADVAKGRSGGSEDRGVARRIFSETLFPASQNCRHDSRIAASVQGGDNPQWFFLRRVGDQIIGH